MKKFPKTKIISIVFMSVCLICLANSGLKPLMVVEELLGQPRKSTKPLSPIEAPDRIDIGLMTKGGQNHKKIKIQNNTAHTIENITITTSCECVTIIPSTISIQAYQHIVVSACINLTNEPLFEGQLSIEVVGKIEGSVEVFNSKITVIVE